MPFDRGRLQSASRSGRWHFNFMMYHDTHRNAKNNSERWGTPSQWLVHVHELIVHIHAYIFGFLHAERVVKSEVTYGNYTNPTDVSLPYKSFLVVCSYKVSRIYFLV